jgi:hypothetical protein
MQLLGGVGMDESTGLMRVLVCTAVQRVLMCTGRRVAGIVVKRDRPVWGEQGIN